MNVAKVTSAVGDWLACDATTMWGEPPSRRSPALRAGRSWPREGLLAP